MFKKNKKNQGVSLIEIMLVISIIGLILVIEAPNLKSYSNNLILKSATQDLASNLRYAQQLTVTEQRIYNITLDQINNSYTIVLEPSTIIKTVYLPDNISFSSITDLTDNKVVFNFMGAVSQSGTITISHSQNFTKTIYIRPSGYIETN